jgi:ubiquitin carboxyl-terminal hydrolase L3
LKSFYEKAKGLSPEERGKLLEGDKDIIEIHQNLAVEGQTEAPADLEEKILFHYVALTMVGDKTDGELMELDGRKNFPVSHGKTTAESFVTDAAEVCKKFMSRDEKELRFTMMAIVAGGDQ